MNYEAAKNIIETRVEASRNDIGTFDLYSMIFADDLHAVMNMIAELELGSEEERLSWEYAYLLGQAIGNIDTAESILHYFGKTMGENEAPLRDAFSAIEAKVISLHPVFEATEES